MAEASGEPKGWNVLEQLREMRDAGLELWAKMVLEVTGSSPYMLGSSMLAKPGLMAAAAARQRTDAAMAHLLAQFNMPSRADVLAISARLTNVEKALDDLAAAVDLLRAPVAHPAPIAKGKSGNARTPRRPTPARGEG